MWLPRLPRLLLLCPLPFLLHVSLALPRRCFLQAVAFGFRSTSRKGYWKDSFNRLDLFVLLVSVAATGMKLTGGGDSFAFIRAFRSGRALRPLRMIKRNESMRVVVTGLMRAWEDLLSVFALSQFVYLIFAIVALNLYAGALYRCNNPAVPDRASCTGTFENSNGLTVNATWANPTYEDYSSTAPFSFDNVWESYLTVRDMVALEGFIQVMLATMDITGPDQQPSKEASKHNSWFTICTCSVGAFFVAQIYAGVIVKNYQLYSKSNFMTEKQRLWLKKQKSLQKRSLVHTVVLSQERTGSAIRLLCQDICLPCAGSQVNCPRPLHFIHKHFENALSAVIVVDILSMTLYGLSGWAEVVDHISAVALIIYGVELILKHVALGFKQYWRSPSNLLDGCIFIGSVLAMLLSELGHDRLLFVVQVRRCFCFCPCLCLRRFLCLCGLVHSLVLTCCVCVCLSMCHCLRSHVCSVPVACSGW